MLLSLRIALAATALTVVTAIPLACTMARRRFVGKSVVEAVILLPLVLPPTVVGYLLILLLGRRGLLGHWLGEAFDYSIVFTEEGAVLAAAIVAFPLLYMTAKSAFASIEREYEDVARVMGARTGQVFFHVSLPMARRGLVSGVLLAFARALGEFGATVMVLGWVSEKVTLPIVVYAAYEQGEMSEAAGAVAVLTAVSLAIMVACNRSTALRQD